MSQFKDDYFATNTHVRSVSFLPSIKESYLSQRMPNEERIYN